MLENKYLKSFAKMIAHCVSFIATVTAYVLWKKAFRVRKAAVCLNKT